MSKIPLEVTVHFQGKNMKLDKVLLDTGSAGTLFSADRLDEIGVHIEPGDDIFMVRGVGGCEYVFGKRVDSLSFDHVETGPFDIEIGAMEYGRPIQGIIGMDLLAFLSANIDLSRPKSKRVTGLCIRDC